MAAVLKCPECGHRHPLDDVTTKDTFRCEGCARPLKVPASLHTDMPAEPAGSASVPEKGPGQRPEPARSKSSTLLPPLHGDAPEAEMAPLRWPWRLLIWIVAFPLGAAAAGLVANALSLVTLDQLEGTVLDTGWGRFSPLARLVPLWALFTALFVTAAIVGIDTLRRNRAELGVHRTEVFARSGANPQVATDTEVDGADEAPVTSARSGESRADSDTEPPETPESRSGGDSVPDGDVDGPTQELPRTDA